MLQPWESDKQVYKNQKRQLTKSFLGLVVSLKRIVYIEYVSTSKNSLN